MSDWETWASRDGWWFLSTTSVFLIDTCFSHNSGSNMFRWACLCSRRQKLKSVTWLSWKRWMGGVCVFGRANGAASCLWSSVDDPCDEMLPLCTKSVETLPYITWRGECGKRSREHHTSHAALSQPASHIAGHSSNLCSAPPAFGSHMFCQVMKSPRTFHLL